MTLIQAYMSCIQVHQKDIRIARASVPMQRAQPVKASLSLIHSRTYAGPAP
jgi:hypothetical protein